MRVFWVITYIFGVRHRSFHLSFSGCLWSVSVCKCICGIGSIWDHEFHSTPFIMWVCVCVCAPTKSSTHTNTSTFVSFLLHTSKINIDVSGAQLVFMLLVFFLFFFDIKRKYKKRKKEAYNKVKTESVLFSCVYRALFAHMEWTIGETK